MGMVLISVTALAELFYILYLTFEKNKAQKHAYFMSETTKALTKMVEKVCNDYDVEPSYLIENMESLSNDAITIKMEEEVNE